MIFLRVHRGPSIHARIATVPEHWAFHGACPTPMTEYAMMESGIEIMHALDKGWLFGATRKQFRNWWPRSVLKDYADHVISVIYIPPLEYVKTQAQVIFNPEKARVIRTLTVEQALYLTRKNRRVPRSWRKELFA